MGLGAVAVNGFGFEAGGVDAFAEFVGSVFGAGEDDGEPIVALIFEVLKEKVLFGILVDEADALIDFLGGGLLGLDGNVSGVLKDGIGEFLDGGRKGGREEEGLLFARESSDDFFDITEEAHVEHAVDFIEDEEIDAGEIDIALIHVVEKAPGAGDENIDALAHGADLGILTDATEDESFRKSDAFAVGLEAL